MLKENYSLSHNKHSGKDKATGEVTLQSVTCVLKTNSVEIVCSEILVNLRLILTILPDNARESCSLLISMN